ncbi:MAG: glycosyltransferase [Minwuia sp.]|nr:glycosyltransferase [Minwuia sp.]
MRRRIVIVSGFQVINNPRVVKEADALSELGHDVTVLAAINNLADLPRIMQITGNKPWHHIPVLDLSDRRPVNLFRHFMMRLKARAAREALVKFGFEHPLQLGHDTGALLRAARSIDADLYSLHLEKSLWVGQQLLADGRKIRVDVEDWYTEDGLPTDRTRRPVKLMRRAEAELLNNAVHSTATSQAMADALVAAYGCPMPEVIHNSFPTGDRDHIDGRNLDRNNRTLPSICWFSQTIGPGRGLETLVAALPLLPSKVEVHLRGTPRAGFIEHLVADLPAAIKNLIYVHPQVPQSELLSRLSEHDIGYCGELSDCISRDVTITNKVFEYMRAGQAIVASNTLGQTEVATIAPDAVRIFAQGNAQSLAAALGPLVENPAARQAASKASVDALLHHFSWEISKDRLQRQVTGYLESLA